MKNLTPPLLDLVKVEHLPAHLKLVVKNPPRLGQVP